MPWAENLAVQETRKKLRIHEMKTCARRSNLKFAGIEFRVRAK